MACHLLLSVNASTFLESWVIKFVSLAFSIRTFYSLYWWLLLGFISSLPVGLKSLSLFFLTFSFQNLMKYWYISANKDLFCITAMNSGSLLIPFLWCCQIGHSFAFATATTISRILHASLCKGILWIILQDINQFLIYHFFYVLCFCAFVLVI